MPFPFFRSKVYGGPSRTRTYDQRIMSLHETFCKLPFLQDVMRQVFEAQQDTPESSSQGVRLVLRTPLSVVKVDGEYMENLGE